MITINKITPNGWYKIGRADLKENKPFVSSTGTVPIVPQRDIFQNNNLNLKPVPIKDLGNIINEGQSIIQGIDRLNNSSNLKEGDVKDILKEINKFLKNLLNEVKDLNNEVENQVTLDEIVNVVKNVAPSTIMVSGNGVLGSGVIITDKNNKKYIITNAHVIEGIEEANKKVKEGEFDELEDVENLEDLFELLPIKNKNEDENESLTSTTGLYNIKLYNGSDFKKPIEFNTKLIQISSSDEHDLAILEIPEEANLPANLGVEMRDLSKEPLKAGEPLIAIGNPLGEKDSVSFGIASHTDRYSELNLNHHIQTDAAINPGNSGGGLFDIKGRLVGINTWAYMGGSSIGGAIRIDYVKKVLNDWGIPLA